MPLYHEGNRAFQDRFDTRRLADRIEERIVHDAIDDDDRAFIEARDMFFLATVDADGAPQCSYKGGEPGFVRVLDEQTIAFPSFDGNGMYLSLGNIAETARVGLLFVDFDGQKRLRLNGVASIDPDDPLLAEYPRAQCIVRVRATEVFPNCPRYIHKLAARRALALHAARRLRAAGAGLEAARVGARRAPSRRSGERLAPSG